MRECFRGGLKTPRIVQEAVNEATILSLVSHGLGVGFVMELHAGDVPREWLCLQCLI